MSIGNIFVARGGGGRCGAESGREGGIYIYIPPHEERHGGGQNDSIAYLSMIFCPTQEHSQEHLQEHLDFLVLYQ